MTTTNLYTIVASGGGLPLNLTRRYGYPWFEGNIQRTRVIALSVPQDGRAPWLVTARGTQRPLSP